MALVSKVQYYTVLHCAGQGGRRDFQGSLYLYLYLFPFGYTSSLHEACRVVIINPAEMISMQKKGQHGWSHKNYHIYVSTDNNVLAVTPDDHFKVMELHDLLPSW